MERDFTMRVMERSGEEWSNGGRENEKEKLNVEEKDPKRKKKKKRKKQTNKQTNKTCRSQILWDHVNLGQSCYIIYKSTNMVCLLCCKN